MKHKIILILGVFLIGCLEQPNISQLAPDQTYPWDNDGDWISNNTENNSANSQYGFDPEVADENPSIAHGIPTNGSLEGGINIWGNGTGYYQWRGGDEQDTDDWGTLQLINTIEGAGRLLTGDQPLPVGNEWTSNSDYSGRFGVLDLSKQEGGDWFPDHESHQNGLDVDIRYVRTDRSEAPFNFDEDPIEDYDYQATLKLFEALYYGDGMTANNIDFFVVDSRAGNLEPANQVWEVKELSGHQNHIHVRIKDPDGTNN